MAGKIQVLIIDEDAAARQALREALESIPMAEIMAETDSLVYGYELIRQNKPQMVFVDLRSDPQRTLEMVSRASTFFKQTLIVVSGSDINMDLIMKCMQAGAREFLTRPLRDADILNTFEKYHASAAVDMEIGDRSGRIVTVFSNKGGLGKTTIAVNTAMALSKVVSKPVVLVDLNLQLGDITTFLDLEPKQTIVDIARNIGRVDKAYLEGSLAEYNDGESQVYILADPINVEDAEELTAEQINEVLTVLRASFEYVIVDTTTSFDSKTLTALDLADDILLVSIINLPSIRSSQRLLNLFERLGYDKQKIKLLINRYIADEEIDVEDVEDTLEHPVYWKIPNNYSVIMTAINRGIPVTQVDGSKHVVKNFIDLAYKLTGKLISGQTTSTAENKGLLGGILGRFGK